MFIWISSWDSKIILEYHQTHALIATFSTRCHGSKCDQMVEPTIQVLKILCFHEIILRLITYSWFIYFIDNCSRISKAWPPIWRLANHVSSNSICWHSATFSHFLWGAEIINPTTSLTHNTPHGKQRQGKGTLEHPAWLCKSIVNSKTVHKCVNAYHTQTNTDSFSNVTLN